MQNLTKIDKPFGELDDETATALFLAWRRGETIEWKDDTGPYASYHSITGALWPKVTYRLAPKPVTPDSIDWSHVAKGWNYMTRDMEGSVWLSKVRPTYETRSWTAPNGGWEEVKTHASYRRGTCDWKDSLVVRPGVEDGE